MRSHSKGNWHVGKNWGIVVTDDGEGFPSQKNDHSGHSATDYYGGYLIAESIAKESDAKLIAAAPDLLDACRQLMHALDNDDLVELFNGKVSALQAIEKATK